MIEGLPVRILMCASSAPLPPMDGFHLLLDHLLRELRSAHEVRLVAQVRHDEPTAGVSDADIHLAPFRRRGRLYAAASAPLPVLRSRPLSDDRRVASLWPAVEQELTRFEPDVVHVAPGRLAAIAPRLEGWPTLLGAVDARHLNMAARAEAASGLLKLGLREQTRRIRRLIATEYGRFGHVTVVTAEDREALLAIDPTLDVTAVPNGVDTEVFRPLPTAVVVGNRVVFTGTMDYVPNVTTARFLATEILPRLRERRPDATLAIAGRRPVPSVRVLADVPGVTVTGEVPDIRPWLVGSRVFAAPMMSGTGIKNKLLEAMACGLPCVVSPLALQGLEVQHDRHMLVADGPEATAEAIARVLDDPRLGDRLGREARRYVERQHSWSRVAATHVELYERVIHAKHRDRTPRGRQRDDRGGILTSPANPAGSMRSTSRSPG